MSDPRERAQELFSLANDLPFGPTKLAMVDEAVHLADSAADVDMAFWLREQLMQVACFSGRPDVILVAFSWCLAQYDRDPQRFDDRSLMWNYKWVVENARKFPQISRSRLDGLLDDMERRYRQHGASMYSVTLQRRQLMIHVGESERARATHAEFRNCRRDSLSDCDACVASMNSDYYDFLRQWQRSVQAARPVLDGRLTCMEQPHLTLASVLLPLVRLGRAEEAKSRHVGGYRLVSRHAHFVRQHAEHLRYLVVVADMAKAKQLLERHLPGALETVLLDERFKFLLAAQLWCERLASRGTAMVKVRLPEGLPAADAAGRSDVHVLGDWFKSEAQELARQFDARNGTNAFQAQIDEIPELLQMTAN